MLRRKEAGTGEPDASMVILSHASDPSWLDVVVRCSAFSQPASAQPVVALLSIIS